MAKATAAKRDATPEATIIMGYVGDGWKNKIGAAQKKHLEQ